MKSKQAKATAPFEGRQLILELLANNVTLAEDDLTRASELIARVPGAITKDDMNALHRALNDARIRLEQEKLGGDG